jgi:riboflavin biosynthesis pyrimidine reductase
LNSLLHQLADREIQRVLVEGGPTTIHRFLDEGLVDEVFLIHSEVVHQEPYEAGLDAELLAKSGLMLAEEYVWGEERVEHYLRTPTSA